MVMFSSPTQRVESGCATTNPLLDTDPLKYIDQIRPEHVMPAIQWLIEQAQLAQETVTNPEFVADWKSIATVLDVATERLALAWGLVNHLNHVIDSPALRAAYNEALPEVTAFVTQLGTDEGLYAKYKAIAATASTHNLNAVQKRALELAQRNFVLGGADLQGAAKQAFADIQEALSQACQKFSENVLDATEQFDYLASSAEVEGLPPDVLATSHLAALEKNWDGHLLTLKMPCYLPVMQYAHNRALREKMYRAYTTRASDQASEAVHGLNNTPVIKEIVTLRAQEAQLLGFSDYAALSLASKMADSSEQIAQFLRQLAAYARPFAEQDLQDMTDFAKSNCGIESLQAWDWLYVSERLKESRYAFNEQEVKQYFTAPRVLTGLFQLIEKIYGVTIHEDQAVVWHPDVRYYRVENELGVVGHFYLDITARKGKQSGAWMDGARDRWLRPDSLQIQTPVAYLVCNFSSAVADQPALLTHDDVITLFHECGHGLHHLLTQISERDVAGINGVEWDAVELPSQFMENFCWEWEIVQTLSGHVQTGDSLPRALFEKMVAAKNFQSGMQTLRQVELALFDLLLHQAPAGVDIQQIQEQVRQEIALVAVPAYNRSANTFSHIFAGGYAAGYYSYKWAEVLASDAYAAFEEAQQAGQEAVLEMAKRFKKEILEVGGSRPAMQSFVAFRGRQPTLHALLKHQGMATSDTFSS